MSTETTELEQLIRRREYRERLWITVAAAEPHLLGEGVIVWGGDRARLSMTTQLALVPHPLRVQKGALKAQL